jgi:hypothetical protein
MDTQKPGWGTWALVCAAFTFSCERSQTPPAVVTPEDDPKFSETWRSIEQSAEPFYIEHDRGEGLMGRVRRVSDLRETAGVLGTGAPTDTILPEQPSAEEISLAVKRYLGNVKFCYQRLSKQGVTRSGRAILSFTINKEGTAGNVRVEAPSFSKTDLADCVTKQIARWTFPRSKQGGLVVSYPIVFVGG